MNLDSKTVVFSILFLTILLVVPSSSATRLKLPVRDIPTGNKRSKRSIQKGILFYKTGPISTRRDSA